jgi:hypothetical protein
MTKEMKTKQLETWVFEHRTLPAQGTKEWLSGRKFRIGGSEVSVIEGNNHYSTIKDLIAQHLGLTHFQGNAATRWGKILEDVTTVTMELLLDCSIYVPGSVPHPEVTVHANSPDGVAYVAMWNAIVLFEFKNPSGRIPGGTIPKMYKSQVWSGLDTIPICDFAIFVDHMQRKCELDDLKPMNRDYDINHHNVQRDRVRNDPIVLTMLGVYCPTKDYSDEKRDVIDYGGARKDIFEDMLLTVDEKRTLSIHYGSVYVCDNVRNAPTPAQWYSEFMTYCKENNYKPIGILPLKTFRLSLIPLYRKPNYIDNLKKVMYEVVQVIGDLDGLDPLVQKDRLNKLYEDPEVRKKNMSVIARKRARCKSQCITESPDSKQYDTQESTDE